MRKSILSALFLWFLQINQNFGLLSKMEDTCVCEATVINGSRISREIWDDLKTTVDTWRAQGLRTPGLTVILVGNNAASEIYIKKKMQAAKYIGIRAETLRFDADVTEEALITKIKSLNEDPDVDGIIVQLPLPKGLNAKKACETISPDKDVDGFHTQNLGRLSADREGLVPATALAVRELIVSTGIETIGRNAVVISRSKLVGLPTALLLHSDGQGETGALDMTTTICHIHTPREELIKFTKLADVLVSATGIPGFVTKDMVKPGACVIDVGIVRVNTTEGKSKIVGDVDYEEVSKVAGFITPVPGGVGPMTVAMLMKNTLWAAEKNLKNK